MSSGLGADQASRSGTGLYKRFRHLIHEGAKFGIVGGIGVVVVLAGSDALHYAFGVGKFTSVTIATVLATVVTFLGNRYWSFRHRQGSGARSETILFFVLNGVGLLIQYACIGLVNDLMGLSGGIWYTSANFVGIGIGTLFRFWSYRKWIWVRPEVALARLRRGRHRKGRTTPVPPIPGSAPAYQPVQVRRPPPLIPHPAAPHPPAQYPQPQHSPQYSQPQHPGAPHPAGPHPAGPHLAGPHPGTPNHGMPQRVPLAKRQVRRPSPEVPAHQIARPLFAATPTPAPATDEPDRWRS